MVNSSLVIGSPRDLQLEVTGRQVAQRAGDAERRGVVGVGLGVGSLRTQTLEARRQAAASYPGADASALEGEAWARAGAETPVRADVGGLDLREAMSSPAYSTAIGDSQRSGTAE
jgi:hypothetical protein